MSNVLLVSYLWIHSILVFKRVSSVVRRSRVQQKSLTGSPADEDVKGDTAHSKSIFNCIFKDPRSLADIISTWVI